MLQAVSTKKKKKKKKQTFEKSQHRNTYLPNEDVLKNYIRSTNAANVCRRQHIVNHMDGDDMHVYEMCLNYSILPMVCMMLYGPKRDTFGNMLDVRRAARCHNTDITMHVYYYLLILKPFVNVNLLFKNNHQHT